MRTLPLRLAPIDGESLPGYVARYSHTYRFPPGDVLRALGLDGGSGTALAAGRYGASLSPRQIEDVAIATGIDAATIGRMLLWRYAGRAFEQPAGGLDPARAAAAQRREILGRCSRFCPHCLHEHGAWLLSWQLRWSFACVAHRVLLLRRCPSCDALPVATLRESWPSDRNGALSDPARCAHRSSSVLCRARLARADAPPVSDGTLAAQHRINLLLDGEPNPPLAGLELDPTTYLRDLRSLCKLVHRHAPPFSQRRSTAQSARRLRDDPADLAAVLPTALALADLPDPNTLAEALRTLADERYHNDGLTLLVSKTGPMSEPLMAALRRAVSRAVWASASRQLGFHPGAHRRPDDLDPRLGPQHIPQLIWADDYHWAIAHRFEFDDATDRHGRRFCSVLLARMLTPLDWDAAARYLDFPDPFINNDYNLTFAKLRSNDRFTELATRVKRIANQHAQGGLIDYKQRRARLAHWEGLDIDSWHLLEPRPRPLPPRHCLDEPPRRAESSLWVWCQLTSGDERAAPIPLRTTHGLSDQTEFIRDALPTLRDRLLILGELLITTPADARATLHNRLTTALSKHGDLAANYHLDTIDPLITDRARAHDGGAHTRVDSPRLTTPSVGSGASIRN
ncbi:MAG: TniQ family protein [Solirubrobacteraceae bacterium]